jgi:homoserine dehydrogenase
MTYIIQLGLGGVGQALVCQVSAQREALTARYGVNLDYLALIDRSGALYTGQALDDAALMAAVASKQAGHSLADQGSLRPLQALLPSSPAIIVDVTAADGMETSLGEAIAAGHRVVLANKRPLTATLPTFTALTSTATTSYEATVGAGLPVIHTLQSLRDSGDEIVRIEASMSGTLGYLCSALEQGEALSRAVQTARNAGWTEPDPRDDLSGADVARKALILARTWGLSWEMDAVASEPWFPPELANVSLDEFLQRLPELDATFAARVAAARTRKTVLRYVATIQPSGASVGLRELPLDHPLAGLRGTDNLFAFTTARYAEQPLVIRGPGTGIEVTAAGVLGDIVTAARMLT